MELIYSTQLYAVARAMKKDEENNEYQLISGIERHKRPIAQCTVPPKPKSVSPAQTG